MNRRERIDQEVFLDSVYERFEEQRLAMLMDESIVDILAADNGGNTQQVKEASIASIRINQAYRLFRLHQNGHLNDSYWIEFKADTKLLFSLPSIQKRWANIQQYYQPGFQKLINEELLHPSTSLNTKEMKLKVVHSTTGCEASSCPTIYLNEAGNYVFQGFKVNPTSKQNLEIPDSEDIIELPKEFVQDFLKKQKIG